VPRRHGRAERGDHAGAHPHASIGIGQPGRKRYWAEMPREGLGLKIARYCSLIFPISIFLFFNLKFP
jgi:hypothetical protein